MSAIKTWSTTAAANNAAAPDGFPENMAPSGVNDAARELMAQVAAWYRDAEWRDLDHAVAYASATSFTVAADVTAIYVPGRRIRCADAATLYGIVVSSSYGAPNTTVTVALDGGSLSAGLSAVALGPAPAALPGGWLPLNRKAAGASAEIDFLLPAGFVAFRFVLVDLMPTTDGHGLALRTSTDGGGSFAAGTGYDYANVVLPAGGALDLADAVDQPAIVLAAGVGGAAEEGLNGELVLSNPAGTARYKTLRYDIDYVGTDGRVVRLSGAGSRRNADAVDAVRFFFGSHGVDTIAGGSIVMLGLRG